MESRLIRISRFLSYLLRHDPGAAGLQMDSEGWVSVDELLASPVVQRRGLTREVLRHLVRTNDKQRYEWDESGSRIRARQGHSVPIQSDWMESEPPDRLYHGTARSFLASIRREGLRKGSRHHVHLSPDAATAARVGARHGNPVVLVIRAGEMHRRGNAFFLTGNGVWLTVTVPPEFIEFPD